MKKCKRWIAILLVTLMCLPLCGCQDLESMRAAHAVWQEDGSILWNGYVYRELEDVSDHQMNMPDQMKVVSTYQSVYVTESDVPVLLSAWFGDSLDVSQGETLLIRQTWDGWRMVYCREDKYEYISEYLEKGAELNTYFYTYWMEDKYEGVRFYYLTDKQKELVDRLMLSLNFVVMDEDFYYSFEDADFSVILGKCDEERLFSDEHVLEIVRKGGRFYLVTTDGHIGEVPAEYDDIMKIIVSVYYNEEVRPYL